ncbi:MAG: hypothetical protein ACI8PZ_007412 [Myxococcota bacterium]|jgi:hypothetical protein
MTGGTAASASAPTVEQAGAAGWVGAEGEGVSGL